MKIRILENDGHNTPCFHLFRDLMQAAIYIADEAEEVETVLQDLEEGEHQDNDMVNWTVVEDLYETDHTQELCDACGDRDAMGDERPECECECHSQDEEE